MSVAGLMLILNKERLILGVSRKNNSNSFGLPGGESKPGEDPMQCAIRETREETSVEVTRCVQIFRRNEFTKERGQFFAYCFYALEWSNKPKTTEQGIVKWITEEELTGSNVVFADYNSKILQVFKMFDRK